MENENAQMRQIDEQRNSLVARFNLAADIALKPIRELQENFQLYINLTNNIINDLKVERNGYKMKLEELQKTKPT
jgi:uncharacterized membrane-anchored protein YhcB (DUF1043 family)